MFWTLGRIPSQGLHLHKNLRYASVAWTGFEATISVFERSKTVRALHRGANVIGFNILITYRAFEMILIKISVRKKSQRVLQSNVLIVNRLTAEI
jgi:hypothetical protein